MYKSDLEKIESYLENISSVLAGDIKRLKEDVQGFDKNALLLVEKSIRSESRLAKIELHLETLNGTVSRHEAKFGTVDKLILEGVKGNARLIGIATGAAAVCSIAIGITMQFIL